MTFFASLPHDAGVRHILGLNPRAGRALIEFTAVLRQDTALAAPHKELLAAYVSGLNACAYCHGVHRQTAIAFGIEETLIERLLDDPDTAPVEPKLRLLLAYARKLTLEPSKMVAADARAVFEAGWTERDLHDAVLTIGLFNLMNRLLEGHGVKGQDHLYKGRGAALACDGYAPLLAHLPAVGDADSASHAQ